VDTRLYTHSIGTQLHRGASTGNDHISKFVQRVPPDPMPGFPRSVHGWAASAVSVADCSSLPPTYGSCLPTSQVATVAPRVAEISSGESLRMWVLSMWIWCAMLLDVTVGHPTVPSLPAHPLLTSHAAVLHPVVVRAPLAHPCWGHLTCHPQETAAKKPGLQQARGRKAIYGADSRLDEADASPAWRAVGRSTVMLVRPASVGNPGESACTVLITTAHK
jgi:hypothetical protein